MRFSIFLWLLSFVLLLFYIGKPVPDHDTLVGMYFIFTIVTPFHDKNVVRDEGEKWQALRATFRTGTIWHKQGNIL